MNNKNTDESHRRQCWDCSSEEFRLIYEDGVTLAECVECGGRDHPQTLYIPDENGKEYYDTEMNDD